METTSEIIKGGTKYAFYFAIGDIGFYSVLYVAISFLIFSSKTPFVEK
jgi:hypothetical protein